MKLQIIEARIAVVHLRNHYLFDVRGPSWLLVAEYKRALEPTLFFVNVRVHGLSKGWAAVSPMIEAGPRRTPEL